MLPPDVVTYSAQIPRPTLTPQIPEFRVGSADSQFVLSQSANGQFATLKLDGPNGTVWSSLTSLKTAPIRIYVSDDRTTTVVLTWGSEGTDSVLAFLDPRGNQVRSYTEDQLFPKALQFQSQLEPAPMWWTQNPAMIFGT